MEKPLMRISFALLLVMIISIPARSPAQTPPFQDSLGGVVTGNETDAMRANDAPCLVLVRQKIPIVKSMADARAQVAFMRTCKANGPDSMQ